MLRRGTLLVVVLICLSSCGGSERAGSETVAASSTEPTASSDVDPPGGLAPAPALPLAWSLEELPRPDQGDGSGGFFAFAQDVEILGSDLVVLGDGHRPDSHLVWSRAVEGGPWEMVEIPDVTFDEMASAVSSDGQVAVVLGSLWTDSTDRNLAAWIGEEPISGFAVVNPEGLGPVPGDVTIADVAGGPKGFVAVGAGGDDAEPAVWFSSDGITWEQVQSDAFADDEAFLTAVVAHDDGFLIAGYTILTVRSPYGGGLQGRGYLTLWWSTDGVEWQTRLASDSPSTPFDAYLLGEFIVVPTKEPWWDTARGYGVDYYVRLIDPGSPAVVVSKDRFSVPAASLEEEPTPIQAVYCLSRLLGIAVDDEELLVLSPAADRMAWKVDAVFPNVWGWSDEDLKLACSDKAVFAIAERGTESGHDVVVLEGVEQHPGS